MDIISSKGSCQRVVLQDNLAGYHSPTKPGASSSTINELPIPCYHFLERELIILQVVEVQVRNCGNPVSGIVPVPHDN
jgi:hypothetical protein